MTATVRLAFAGLAPDRVRALVAAHGTAETVVARILRRDVAVGDEARKRVEVVGAVRLKELEASGVAFVERGDPGFPSRLAGLPDGPDWLFVRGQMAAPSTVAIVGSRRATAYGLGVARALAAECARMGATVVSGLAAGIDGVAHEGALEHGAATVAVLGSGIDVWYPRRHRTLGERILAEGGGVVSEFPPGTPPEAWRFPTRNRIIAGLADVVVVVEAAERSGALITARLGAEMGKEVLAVPGDIDRATSIGCNQLIRDGAHPLDQVGALSELFGFARERHLQFASTMSLDEIVAGLGLPPQEALVRVGEMEQRGEVVRAGDGSYAVTACGDSGHGAYESRESPTTSEP